MTHTMTYIRTYRFILILLVAAILLPTQLGAQRAYTLDECTQAALQNNVRMQNASNNLSNARLQRKEAFTQYFPNISASGGGFLADRELIKIDASQDLSMGMMKNGIVGGISATMPLFAGGQIINGNRLAEVNIDKYRQLQRQDENTVRLTVEQYFWRVAMLEEKLKTLGLIEKQLAQMEHDAEAAVSAGVANRNDLLQVELRQNDTQSSRLTVENALTLSRRLLAQYIGAETDQVNITFSFTDSLPPAPDSLYRQPREALALTPEYNLLQANLKASKLQQKITVGKNLPSVALGGGYMYDNLTDRDSPFWIGFATVSIPLSGWWGGSQQIKQQKLLVRNAENELCDQSQLLILHMQSAWDDLCEAWRQVDIARRSIAQSQENLRLQSDYYMAGTCSMSDLLDAQALYQQSRDKYVEARAQYEVKKREYLQATGR